MTILCVLKMIHEKIYCALGSRLISRPVFLINDPGQTSESVGRKKLNLHYARGITPKRVTSRRSAEGTSQLCRAVSGN